MDTIQLDKIVTAFGFLGTFPYDEIPPKPDKDHSLIINTSPSDMPGEHWVALVYNKPIFYFFDSYGRSLKDATFPSKFSVTIKKYIGQRRVRHNSKWLQQLTSNTCGDYCVYFIQEIAKVSFKKLISVFTENLKRNDQFVLNYVKTIS